MLHVDSNFTGIGGFERGFHRAAAQFGRAYQIDVMCEKEDYPLEVLNKYWPGVPKHRYIQTLGDFTKEEKLDGPKFLCVGGLCCQPFSPAGLQLGALDQSGRYLVREFAEYVNRTRPRWVVVENVDRFASLNDGLDSLATCLEASGYTCGAVVLPSSSVGAPMRRNRLFMVCHAGGVRRQTGSFNPPPIYLPSIPRIWNGRSLLQPRIHRLADGLPTRLSINKLQAYGNAVVPDLAYVLFSCLLAVDEYFYGR